MAYGSQVLHRISEHVLLKCTIGFVGDECDFDYIVIANTVFALFDKIEVKEQISVI